MNLFPANMQAIQGALDAASLRQQTIANNVANVDTPFYKSQHVSFEKEFARALNNNSQSLRAHKTNSEHISFKHEAQQVIEPQLNARTNTIMQHNGNNVDMDLEMADMAKNQIRYEALVDRLNGQFQKMRTVITEGR